MNIESTPTFPGMRTGQTTSQIIGRDRLTVNAAKALQATEAADRHPRKHRHKRMCAHTCARKT